MTRATKLSSILVVFLVVGLICGVAIQRTWQAAVSGTIELTQPTIFKVALGSSANKVLGDLHQQYFNQHPLLIYKLWLKLNPEYSQVKAGTYQLKNGMSLQSAFELIRSGREYTIPVTLIEGLTFSQWLSSLASTDGVVYDIDDMVKADLLSMWHERMGQPNHAPQLEGLFLADTYYVTLNTKASDVLKRAMLAMVEFLEGAWRQRTVGLPLQSPYEALTLASIVEKETAVASERPLIAGVFVNRLNLNMRLQTDPTIIYGLGERFDGDITRKHLREPTPYNTYVIKGLTPTPIAMAGKLAITSVLHPSQTDYLYFVSQGDGTHYFSATLAEHNAAVRKYQLKK